MREVGLSASQTKWQQSLIPAGDVAMGQTEDLNELFSRFFVFLFFF